jgi:hypothetical protein
LSVSPLTRAQGPRRFRRVAESKMRTSITARQGRIRTASCLSEPRRGEHRNPPSAGSNKSGLRFPTSFSKAQLRRRKVVCRHRRANRPDRRRYPREESGPHPGRSQGHIAARNALFVLRHGHQPGRDKRRVDSQPWHEPRDGTVVVSIMPGRAHRDLRERGEIAHACWSDPTACHRRLLPGQIDRSRQFSRQSQRPIRSSFRPASRAGPSRDESRCQLPLPSPRMKSKSQPSSACKIVSLNRWA